MNMFQQKKRVQIVQGFYNVKVICSHFRYAYWRISKNYIKKNIFRVVDFFGW